MISIPEDKLPDYLKDELRLNVLFAPLRSKSVNPNDWNSKIGSWKEIIYLYCSCNVVYSFSLESLKAALHHNGRTPSCLNEVIQQMEINGDIEPLASFLQRKPKSWKEWASDKFISTPVSWTFNKMKNLILAPDTKIYVPLKLVEKEADVMMNKMLLYHKGRILSLREVLDLENKTVCKGKDYKILLTSLQKSGKVDILELQEGNGDELDSFLIKVANVEVEPITEWDLGIYTLKQNERMIEKSIGVLEDNIMECNTLAKSHILKGHRELARACLRKKHDLKNRIGKKSTALYNVQVLLHKLQDGKMDGDIWESYKKAISAFETTYKKGMNEDSVEETMLKLGEVMEIHADIQTTLGRPVIDDDADWEEELEKFFKESNDGDDQNTTLTRTLPDENVSEALKNLDLGLPDVPSSPTSNKSEENLSKQLS